MRLSFVQFSLLFFSFLFLSSDIYSESSSEYVEKIHADIFKVVIAKQSVYEENRERGLMVVGVSVDSPSALDSVKDFLGEMGVTYDILLDPDMVSTDVFAAIGLPATFLIDGDGVVRFTRLGPIAEGDPAFLEALEQTLQ